MKKYFYLFMLIISVALALPVHAAKISPAHQNREITCMGEAIFYEADGEPYQGKIAVGNVILNRMSSGIYPKTVCGVVAERGQFQWTRNHKLRKNRVYRAQKRDQRIQRLAASLYRQYQSGQYRAGKKHDVTRGALFFSSNGIRPSPRAVKGVKIGRHQFFTLRKFKFKDTQLA